MRMVSLLLTLLVLAYIVVQLLGGKSGGPGTLSANNARAAETKAEQVQQVLDNAVKSQDRQLTASEGGSGDSGTGQGSATPGGNIAKNIVQRQINAENATVKQVDQTEQQSMAGAGQ